MRHTKKMSPVAMFSLAAFSLVVAAIAVFGCAWPGTSHSVRFNGYQSEREMGRLPPLPNMANGLNTGRAYWNGYEDSEDSYDDYSSSEDGSKKLDDLWERAQEAEKSGNLHLVRDLLVQYLKDGVGPLRRNSATDRLDALNAIDHGASTTAVTAYLEARHCHDEEKRENCDVEKMLEAAARDRNLKDNVAYLKAAESYQQENFAEAAAAFKSVAERFPGSEKREAALFMTAVAMMKTSAAYIAASGNADYDYGETVDITIDQAWHNAYAAFQKVINEYPRGKYFNDARSWKAYLLLRRRDRAAALAQYYRLLSDSDEEARYKAAFSLMLIRSPATEDEMARVQEDLADEPQAALAYAYHNIYNYSIDPGPSSPPYQSVKNARGEEDWEATRARNEELEKQWRNDLADLGHKELIRTLEFSKRLMARYPNLSIGGAFALRAAQASEELGENETAITFAQRALRSSLKTEERTQSLWTLGVAQHRVGKLADARASFEKLLRDDPKTKFHEEARRMLAMIAEDDGDLDAALDQYIALDYDVDVAYLVDYLMTPDQLAAFIQKHPDSPKKNEFTYALGVRYLRLNRWNEARQTFAQVKTSENTRYDYYCSMCGCDPNKDSTCADPIAHSMSLEKDETGRAPIPSSLLLRDIQTANDLEALEHAAAEAGTDEAKAEALYQYASYQYSASSLVFYNPFETPGYFNLGEFAGQGKYRKPDEAQVLFESQQQHDRLARALQIYLNLAKRFPQTRAARDALYTAAVCHERLSNYNPYWRLIYMNGLHAGERMVTYDDVKATYPNYQLPRGTYGWEPSTRTVNGGPGWAAAPKPPPRLTKRQRLKLFVDQFKATQQKFIAGAIAFWIDYVRRWLIEFVMVVGFVYTFRTARRDHKQLRKRIARHRIAQSKQTINYPWIELFWIDPEQPSRREQIKKLLHAKRDEVAALARDRRSRPVLWRNIVSSSAVIWLMISLIWTLWSG
jgi:TolA-binding protein